MVPLTLLDELRRDLLDRQIGAGISLLTSHLEELARLDPSECHAGLAVGTLAQWVDVGFDDRGLLPKLIGRFDRSSRNRLTLANYVHLRMAEARLAMVGEDLAEALRHLDFVLAMEAELEDRTLIAIADFWKARCFRRSGEYDRALEVIQRANDLAVRLGAGYLSAVIRTVEGWLMFQKGKPKEAARLLQEASATLRECDDYIALGNIQSAYGRMARREGRYDHALQHFEASIEFFQKRAALEPYLARSLTNIAQAKRLLALQIRRNMEAEWELRRHNENGLKVEGQPKAARLERMHQLLKQAQSDLERAAVIYDRGHTHHGSGNVRVNAAYIHLDRGNFEGAEESAREAFELGATKADYILMCRARILQALVGNARFEEQIGEGEDSTRYAQIAHDCATEAVELAKHTQSRRLLGRAHICQGLTLVNGFFNNPESARVCLDRAEGYLEQDRHDALWEEFLTLKTKILRAGTPDPNLRAWSEGAVGDKTLQEVVVEFEELLIPKVWEREDRKVSRVARRLSVSPKKVRRILRRLGLLSESEAT
ncbi:MAG TPA: hypothetical protein VH325_11880 [Bryobacteraceae bacterium]|jgi:tetratricopeptide (TPR) repeat protein|nr:hypothetical protein [Bryobacteraceae bacterium]